MTDLTKDEVLAMATEAGFLFSDKGYGPDVLHTDGLEYSSRCYERFATLCRAPLVAENAALKQAHEINADTLNAMQVEIDDWKARALKAEQAGDRAVPDAEDYDLIDRYLRNNLDDADYGEYLAALDRLVTPQPAAQEQTSAVPVVRQMVEALERKLPGGKQTDDFESSRIGDYNQGWNDYRKAVKKMFKNINMNSSENSNPDAYLYSLEYGEKVVDTKVSIHQLNYPFGVAGADYLVRNDDGVSYVRQTKLYAALSRALAAGQKFIKENGK